MIIVPAILEKEKQEFWARCEQVEKMPGVSLAQVDFCDGKFVPTETLSITEIDVLNPTLAWEAHLMVMEPVDFFDYQLAGFGGIIVHLESFSDEGLVATSLAEIKRLGMKAGLAINPETPIEALLEHKDSVAQFTLLTVHPGRQGQGFVSQSLERIKHLRSLLPDAIIEVDGGINLSNIKAINLAGADMCAVGAGIWKSKSPSGALEQLRQEGTSQITNESV